MHAGKLEGAAELAQQPAAQQAASHAATPQPVASHSEGLPPSGASSAPPEVPSSSGSAQGGQALPPTASTPAGAGTSLGAVAQMLAARWTVHASVRQQWCIVLRSLSQGRCRDGMCCLQRVMAAWTWTRAPLQPAPTAAWQTAPLLPPRPWSLTTRPWLRPSGRTSCRCAPAGTLADGCRRCSHCRLPGQGCSRGVPRTAGCAHPQAPGVHAATA